MRLQDGRRRRAAKAGDAPCARTVDEGLALGLGLRAGGGARERVGGREENPERTGRWRACRRSARGWGDVGPSGPVPSARTGPPGLARDRRRRSPPTHPPTPQPPNPPTPQPPNPPTPSRSTCPLVDDWCGQLHEGLVPDGMRFSHTDAMRSARVDNNGVSEGYPRDGARREAGWRVGRVSVRVHKVDMGRGGRDADQLGARWEARRS